MATARAIARGCARARRDDGRGWSSTSEKRVTFVRHAEGFHNLRDAVTFDVTYNSAINFDARLTPRGEKQCADVAASGACGGAELVVTSPMTRCAQTSLLCFPYLVAREDVPFVANEDVRETVNYWCDRRRATEELEREFGSRIDFSRCPATDELWEKYERLAGPPDQWTKHRESCDLYSVANRLRAFLTWLAARPERDVVVCSHSATLRCLFSYGHPGGVRGAPEQIFDTGGVPDTAQGMPVIVYDDDVEFERSMRADFENAEYRTCVVDFSYLSPREA
ncbi:Histidine phosphatase superfamily, clade-1 [Ostreococcus tauri]|uniref:Histidine phosphatase superfamily, clade-1 n=1 Tax=Ostreococcus tauri TaxID=70448 RepID=Q017Q9_OSTTA|nr:Histidine phosphatase superfamily, clade-1 [Ostreococcus tauri]CAL53352.1 Histidine phosphatase superfamily, clade-1 [Ostreococcus tauri]|eukprot:XP_003079706.1 Histidine phosphatase superfamily, clade-1 [Ostreococcus tauri]